MLKNIIQLRCTAGAFAYAVKERNETTLIDTGFPGKGEAILAELATHGIEPGAIKRILLTHADTDHTGGIAPLVEKTGCKVYVSAEDKPVLCGEQSPAGVKKLMALFSKTPKIPSVSVLPKGYIGLFLVLPTPGHTPGHTCFQYKNVLFAGDLIQTAGGQIKPMPFYFTWKRALETEAQKKLDLSKIEWLCPAHGEPVKAHPAWDQFVAQR